MNYKALMVKEPTFLVTLTNSLNQKIDLYESPTWGDDAPIIAVCHELELAEYTDFFDTYDMTDPVMSKEYAPVFINGELWSEFEVSKRDIE